MFYTYIKDRSRQIELGEEEGTRLELRHPAWILTHIFNSEEIYSHPQPNASSNEKLKKKIKLIRGKVLIGPDTQILWLN